jgi:hypothetical protein
MLVSIAFSPLALKVLEMVVTTGNPFISFCCNCVSKSADEQCTGKPLRVTSSGSRGNTGTDTHCIVCGTLTGDLCQWDADTGMFFGNKLSGHSYAKITYCATYALADGRIIIISALFLPGFAVVYVYGMQFEANFFTEIVHQERRVIRTILARMVVK